MTKEEKTAIAIGNDQEVIDRLDALMTCPNDRAYIACLHADCAHNRTGECTVFMVLDKETRTVDGECRRQGRLS